MSEFRVESFTYRARAMDAFTQMSLASKISPLIASGFAEILPFAIKLRKEGIKDIANVPLKQAAEMLGPIARELAKMPEDDRRFIMTSCLSLCERQQDGKQGWEPIWNPGAGMAMHKDINEDMTIMIRIAIGVIQATLSRFSLGSLSTFLA